MYEDMIGENLVKVLKKLDKKNIKICSDGGCTFWYAGDREFFLKNIDKLSIGLFFTRSDAKLDNMFIPLKHRRILDMFDSSSVVDDSVVIYTKGDENGFVWFIGEKPEEENGSKLLERYEQFKHMKRYYRRRT